VGTRSALVAVVAALAVTAPAQGAVGLGILGNPDRFASLTGQQSQVRHVIVGWGQGLTWGSSFRSLLAGMGPTPMLGFGTAAGGSERITPRGIAQGAGDAYLAAMAQALADDGRAVYVRPMGEMNGHWNPYSAYNRNGTPRDAAHSTAAFRKAFARISILLHGGTADQLSAKLRRLGLPPFARDLPENPAPTLQVVWNPQGYGSPDVPGNRAQAYYPGDAYVDVVGDDLYDIGGKAEFAAADRLYRAHPSKPFGFPEWGLWGLDDPAFVRDMARWVKAHPRTELLSYFNSKAGSIWDLASKPRSRATYRQLIVPLGG
jgi:hypothetical protein